MNVSKGPHLYANNAEMLMDSSNLHFSGYITFLEVEGDLQIRAATVDGCSW